MRRSFLGPVAVVCALTGFLFSPPLAAEDLKQVKSQLNQLQKKVLDLEVRQQEGRGRVSTFLAERLSLGGFFEHAVTAVLSPDASYKLSASSHLLAMNIAAELHPKFHLVNQSLFFLTFPLLNEHDVTLRTFGPAAFGSLVAHAYGQYRFNEHVAIQMGLGWIPFGIAAANREFPLFLRRNGPLISSGGLGVPFGVWTGAHLLGDFVTDMGTFGYHGYTATPTTNTNTLGGGSRFWWRSTNGKLTLGVSDQVLKLGASDVTFNLGADLELKLRPFGFRTEYARGFAPGEDIWTVYGEPYVELGGGKWILHGIVDYANRPTIVTDAATFTPFEKLEYGGGVNWLPFSFLKLRLLFLYHDYVGASSVSGGSTNDYFQVDYSTAIEF